MPRKTKPQKKKQKQSAKYTMKDSVFSDLFGDKKYLLKLYQAIHPEDLTATEDDLKNVTIKNVLVDAMYNDLRFRVRDRLMVLVEAQSTWSFNIIIRSFLYLAKSYQDYFDETEQSLYSSTKAVMPEPELYVIFTGTRVHKPEVISLSEEFFGGKECAVDVRVKVLYGGEEHNIINEYIMFTKVYNEQMRLHGRTEKAVTETIRICKDRNVLREYLESREKEVHDIMFSLFDDEYILKMFMKSEKKRVEEETAKRVEEETTKRVEEETTKRVERETTEKMKAENVKKLEETAGKIAENLLKCGKLSVDEIAKIVPDISLEEIKALEQKLKQNI